MTNVDHWIHAAPAQWTRGRLKNLIASATNGTWGVEPKETDEGVRCIRAADFDRTKRRAKMSQAPLRSVDASSLRQHRLQPGDLVLEKSGGGEKQPVGMAVLFEGPGKAVCSNFCARISPERDVDPRFLTYVFAAAYDQGLTQSAIKQTTGIQNLDAGTFFSASWAYPGVEEQRRIADFLDAETARIDAIQKRRDRQTELLDEAAFTRAFDAVRGKGATGSRKSSGLAWLGTVPADWRIASVSHLFEVELGKMLNQERVTGDHLRPYLRVANVQWDDVDTQELAFMEFPPSEQPRYRLREGDVLVCEGGSWPGRAAIWDGRTPEMYYQKALHRIRAREDDLPRWLYYCLLVAERMRVFAVQGNTSTMTHLTREQLRPQRFPFPDVPVQRSIVEQLDAAGSRDRGIKRLLKKQHALLAERRQALITAAVTGQFDVSTASGRNVTDGVHP
ncbi:restriction endonuclease subunit S [Streptomyces sp. CB01580]|uniref:restriction endonuclease subunit S n=1 Tax=Streptomyces sp. CB01580 TaxID=1703933 RepID=UPI0009A0E452|nr:restriction endonuclease subunit S [Streptomyces sp. CB01580]